MIPPDTKLLFILKYLRAELELLQLHPDYNDLISDDLCGFCALSAGRTQHVLSKLGYNIKSVVVPNEEYKHCYCLLDDALVIDLTATQFGEQEIYITTNQIEEDDLSPWFSSGREVFDSYTDLYYELLQMGWTKKLVYYSSVEVKIRDFCALNGVKFIDDDFLNSISKYYKNEKSLRLDAYISTTK